MAVFDAGLKPGDIIDNSKLRNIFKCGPQGGMRRSHRTSSLVIVSNHIESIYEDRWDSDGKIFHYTGMGREGDQVLDGTQNRTLRESSTNGVGVFLFEVFRDGEYFYQGRVELSGDPYDEQQPDENENQRKVWVFPLRLAGALPRLP